MSNNLRSIILNKVVKPLKNLDNVYQDKMMCKLRVKFNITNGMYSFVLPLQSKYYNVIEQVQNIEKNDLPDIFDNIMVENDALHLNMLRDKYVKTILEHNYSDLTPPLLVNNNKNIMVEFSSPNIAKPFHLGHLRSTIIGNFIANINNFLQNKVTKINYLGDWGTQVGLIQVGIKVANIDNNEMQMNPIKALYKAYVAANNLAETDTTISERAKEVFRQLEFGDFATDTIYKDWKTLKNYTVQELEKTYKKIGVTFDEYHWESMYTAKNVGQIISQMEEMQLLTLDKENRKVVPVTEVKSIPLIKSDGTTLYITRDIAAAIDRFEKNKFDKMYYVVDKSQSSHFGNLVQILSKMKLPWSDRVKHIKFGRVRDMSTRQGTAIFLEDILNEAKETMKKKQICTSTTKVSSDEIDDSSNILGISGVIIHDLKQNRMNDYTFNWDSIYDVKGDTGIKLQYAHSRLTNLELNCGANLTKECDPNLLREAEVDDLIILISKFDEIILTSYERIEPCILTRYLFDLSNAINKALTTLNIKNEPSRDVGSQRLLLFHASKMILAKGMKLLGLTPLERM